VRALERFRALTSRTATLVSSPLSPLVSLTMLGSPTEPPPDPILIGHSRLMEHAHRQTCIVKAVYKMNIYIYVHASRRHCYCPEWICAMFTQVSDYRMLRELQGVPNNARAIDDI
jgi:hypothetical protein